MKRYWLAGLTGLFLTALVVTISAANPGVTLIGTGFIRGDALDRSGLAGKSICQKDDETVCIDQATLGGLGSGVTYTGFDNVFIATPDRGPFDGRTNVPYKDRVHLLHITVDTKATSFPNIKTVLLDTRFLRDEWRRNFVNDAYAFDTTHPFNTLRFDPEAVAVSPFGNFFVSDEYGPYVREFERNGHLIRRIPLPGKFRLDPETGHPSGDVDSDANSLELQPSFNVTGRQANRGMEGLAITPNGRTLVGIMQNALIQDASDGAPNLLRIVTIDIASGRTTHEYPYLLTTGSGVSDIVALNNHELLVDERDGKGLADAPGEKAKIKQILKIDLQSATDISNMTGSEAQTHAVAKTLFLDIVKTLNNAGITSDLIPAKIEGTAFGPDVVVEGVKIHTFWVANDNDFLQDFNKVSNSNPNQFWVFGFKDSDLDGSVYVPQQTPSF